MSYFNGQSDVLTGKALIYFHPFCTLSGPLIPLVPHTDPKSSLAIVKSRTDQPGNLGNLHIILYTPTPCSITLLIHPPPRCESQRVTIPIDPPIKDPYELRSRLIRWKHEALRKYSVVRSHPCSWTRLMSIAGATENGLLCPAIPVTLCLTGDTRSRDLGVRQLRDRGVCRLVSREDRQVWWGSGAMDLALRQWDRSFLRQSHSTTALVVSQAVHHRALMKWVASGARAWVHGLDSPEIRRPLRLWGRSPALNSGVTDC